MLLRRVTEHVKEQNWFAVVLDFFVVIAGILIALQISNISEIRKQRLALVGCRTEAYQAIADKLTAPGDEWPGMPGPNDDGTYNHALPKLLRSPMGTWGSRVWDAELARGTVNQMGDERFDLYNIIFIRGERAEALQDEIRTLQAQIAPLAVSLQLGQSDRLHYLGLLSELDGKSSMLEVFSEQIIDSVETLGLVAPLKYRDQVQDDLKDLNESNPILYGDCYEPITFPIFDWLTDEEELPE